jgi:hypothetical protein
MIDLLAQLRDEVQIRVGQPDWRLLISFDPMAPFGPNDSPVPAVFVTAIAPGAIVGRKCTHTEVLNPCDDWDDELYAKVASDITQAIATLRSRQLAVPD